MASHVPAPVGARARRKAPMRRSPTRPMPVGRRDGWQAGSATERGLLGNCERAVYFRLSAKDNYPAAIKMDRKRRAGAFAELVSKARNDVVVIIDEVQHALSTEDGDNMLLALKAARDEINTRPDTPGHFLFIGTGSHRARVRELTIKGRQAF